LVPGFEVAGEVVERGAGVDGLEPGDRVLAAFPTGGYAEEVVTSSENVVPIPEEMDFVTAAAFPVAYSTSHVALVRLGRLRAGEVLVVQGAAGNVGSAAVGIGKRLGATVIATAGGPERLEVAAGHGADHLVDYRREDVAQRVMEVTQGRGADAIYDAIGDPTALDYVGWEGRILVVGFASGRFFDIPRVRVLLGNCAVIGVNWGAYLERDAATVRGSLVESLGWYREGALKLNRPHTLPLSKAPAALNDLLAARSPGKVVLTTGRS